MLALFVSFSLLTADSDLLPNTREASVGEPSAQPPQEVMTAPASPNVGGTAQVRPGLGLFIAAAPLGATGLALKIMGTVFNLRQLRAYETGRENPDDCPHVCYPGAFYNALGTIFWAPSIALVGGGMHRRMRAVARSDRRLGRARWRRAQVYSGIGYGLLITGAATFAAMQVSKLYSSSEPASVALTEAGWWLGLAQGYAGATLAGWGDGYRRGSKRTRVEYSFAPVATRSWHGIAISGRF